jgi:hypothetical protein
MKVYCDLKEHESLFLQTMDTFRKHKIHSTFEGLSCSVQHEGMPAVCDDTLTELTVFCALALKWGQSDCKPRAHIPTRNSHETSK